MLHLALGQQAHLYIAGHIELLFERLPFVMLVGIGAVAVYLVGYLLGEYSKELDFFYRVERFEIS